MPSLNVYLVIYSIKFFYSHTLRMIINYYKEYERYKRKYQKLTKVNIHIGGGDDLEKMGYQYYFFHTEFTPDEQFNELLRRSDIRIEKDAIEKYIIYDGYEIKVIQGNGNYKVNQWIIHQYAKSKNIISKEEIMKLVDEINSKLDKHEFKINERQIRVIDYSFDVSNQFPIPNKFQRQYSIIPWVALLKHIESDKIIGYYAGNVVTDERGRRYNTGSIIELEQSYHGKHLCTPFVTKTYSSLINELKLEYLYISVAASNTKYACNCYVKAALFNKLRCFIDGVEITKYNECALFDVYPNAKLTFTTSIGMEDDILRKHILGY